MTAAPSFIGMRSKTRAVHAGALDWFTPAAPLTIAAPGDSGRAIELIPAAPGERRFAFEIEVGYPALGTRTLRGIVGEESDLERLFTARPYWNTQLRRRVARLGAPPRLAARRYRCLAYE